MAIIACHECKAEVSTEAKACPKCGAKVKAPTTGFTWFVAGAGGFVLLTFIIVLAGQKTDPDQDRARMTYKVCKEDLAAADRARDHARGRFVAEMCEKLRQEYIAKYRQEPW